MSLFLLVLQWWKCVRIGKTFKLFFPQVLRDGRNSNGVLEEVFVES